MVSKGMTSEASEIASESRRLEQARSRCPKAEALYGEVMARNGSHCFDMLELALGGFVERGREVTPEEEASVWRALNCEPFVAVSSLPPALDQHQIPGAARVNAATGARRPTPGHRHTRAADAGRAEVRGDPRAGEQMRNSAAVAPQEREPEPMKVNDAFPSTYLKQADLKGKRVAVVIDRVEVEEVGQGDDKDTKPVVYFKGAEKGFVLNRGNADTIVSIVGDDETDHWGGHKIVLYVDPSVMYAGKKTGGIRVAPPPQGQGSKPAPPPPPEVVEGFQADDSDVPF